MPTRNALIWGTVVVLAVAALAVMRSALDPAPTQKLAVAVSVPPPAHAVPPPSTTAAPAPTATPAFDVVRVSPSGYAVLAGRAAPESDVTVLESGKVVGVARADMSGSWVLVPKDPLAPGAAELSLRAQGTTGAAMESQASVLLVVPAPDAPPGAAPVAVLAVPTAPSRLLQGPESVTPGKLGLDTVDYDDHGAIRFSGTAPPRTPLRVYVDGAPVGDAATDASGRWTLSPANPVDPGVHKLRLDQLSSNGRVASRIELPFLRETLAQGQVPPGTVVVQPKQNLWRLARRAYGNGIRYTVIYQANRDQIRDPRLIYVGQVFAIPAVATP